VFVPPTALLKRIPEDRPIAIISSGLLERSSSSLFSSDLFLVGEIQRSAMCFGGRYQLGKAVPNKASVGLQRRFESAPQLRPLLGFQEAPSRVGLLHVASAPLDALFALGGSSDSLCAEEWKEVSTSNTKDSTNLVW
ncbi:unnamed protein product, partial [Polarella glacialis]